MKLGRFLDQQMPDIFFKCEACGNYLVVDEVERLRAELRFLRNH